MILELEQRIDIHRTEQHACFIQFLHIVSQYKLLFEIFFGLFNTRHAQPSSLLYELVNDGYQWALN